MNFTAIRYPLTVFYDASCPTCTSEIRALEHAHGRWLVALDAIEAAYGAVGRPANKTQPAKIW